ncbi:MAG: DnaJ domain-containing protein [Streptosporangiales bacterium]|nr:DnaJ domain-containing protein [Streptosporangiales bacterium]
MTAAHPDPHPHTEAHPDPYAVLGLPRDPDLTDQDVHRAYRIRLRAAHPDRGGTPDRAAQIAAAYTALRSAVRRADVLQTLTPGLQLTSR